MWIQSLPRSAAAAILITAALVPASTTTSSAFIAATITLACTNKRSAITAMLLLAQHAQARFLAIRPDARPTPAHSLDRPANLDEGQIFFDKIGETSFAMGAAGLLMPFNVTAHLVQLDDLDAGLVSWLKEEMAESARYVEYTQKNQQGVTLPHRAGGPASTWNIAEALRQRIDGLRARGTAILGMKDSLAEETARGHREKRFLIFTTLFIASLVIAASSTALSIYSTVELQNVKAEADAQGNVLEETATGIDRLAHRLEDAESAIADHSTHATNVAAMLMLQEVSLALYAIEQRLADMESVMTAAIGGRLAPAVLVDRDLKAALLHLGRQASLTNHQILLVFPSDFLQCTCSFIMNDTGFDVIAHVPMAPEDTIMSVYQYSPLPMPVHDDFYGTPTSDLSLLAVNHQEDVYRGLTQATLSTCRRIGAIFQCDKFNAVRRARRTVPEGVDEELCLFSLFRRQLQHAKATCNWKLTTRPEAAVQVNRNTFAVIAQEAHRGVTTCWNNTNSADVEFEENRYTKLTLQPGCRAQSDGYIMAAPLNGKTENFYREHRTRATDFTLLLEADFSEIKSMTKERDNLLYQREEFTLGEATQAWLHKRNSKDAWKHPANLTSYILCALAIIIALILAYACMRKAELQKHAPPAYTMPVPSAPPTIITAFPRS